jgi:hypothetical protein
LRDLLATPFLSQTGVTGHQHITRAPSAAALEPFFKRR